MRWEQRLQLLIYYKQIEIAKKFADKINLDIEFHVCDSMKLDALHNDMYDLVYTSNGVHVWINDLNAMYKNIHRVLKNDGRYMMFDTHPFSRPFGEKVSDNALNIVKAYEATGPFGEVPNFHWRTQDYINSLINSGFYITRMEEFHSIIRIFMHAIIC